ncbi:unnamed protein product, partial [Clonostachys rosea f. rosea IK726]
LQWTPEGITCLNQHFLTSFILSSGVVGLKMAGDSIPTLHSLEKPENFKDVLRRDGGDDCLPCRLIGSGAFFGLAGYSYFSGMSQLQKQQAQILQSKSIFGMRSRKAGIASISFGLAWMGLWRLMN